MNTFSPDPPGKIPLPRRLFNDFLALSVVSFVCAAIVTWVIRAGSPYWMNVVFSYCIGGMIMVFIQLGRWLFWRERRPTFWPFMANILAGIVLGYSSGVFLARTVLGMPMEAMRGNFSAEAAGIWVMTFLVGVGATWFFWNRQRVAQLEAQAASERARAEAVEKQALQAQLQLLQTQIEPHMLFNTLANLQGLIALDPPRAQHMLDQLIQYLRATLKASRAGSTTLGGEFTLLEAYLGLMAVRMGSRLQYRLDLPDALRDLPMPPMLLQPLIENAIKHGLEPKVDGGRIDVTARRDGERLSVTVADTGLGMDEHGIARHSEPGTGVGLANIRERLAALHGADGNLTLTANTPSGVIATLTLPSAP